MHLNYRDKYVVLNGRHKAPRVTEYEWGTENEMYFNVQWMKHKGHDDSITFHANQINFKNVRTYW